MSNPVPGAIALATIADDAEILAADHRNNYAAIQTAVNELVAALSGGTSGQILQAVDATDVIWANRNTIYRKTSQKDVANTVTETDLLNGEISIPGNLLGANGAIRGVLTGDLLNNSGGGDGPTFRVKFGGTTFYAQAFQTAASANRRQWTIAFDIYNQGLANAQWARGRTDGDWSQIAAAATGLAFSNANAHPSAPWSVSAAQAIDTTATQPLAVTAQWGTASATRSCRLQSAYIEVIS